MMLTLSSYPELKGELISVREKILEAISATSEDIKVPLTALVEGNGKMLRPAFSYCRPISGTSKERGPFP
jgi:geranylgeranyl pyrophosphate synthase